MNAAARYVAGDIRSMTRGFCACDSVVFVVEVIYVSRVGMIAVCEQCTEESTTLFTRPSLSVRISCVG
jgi:hypothetical protein